MKKSYVFNTLICCGCTALIFLLHFIVYGGVLLKSPGYTGLFCAVWIAQAAGYSGTLEPKIRPHTAVRVRLWQLLYCILFGNVLFVTIEEPYNVLCWFCVVTAGWLHVFHEFSDVTRMGSTHLYNGNLVFRRETEEGLWYAHIIIEVTLGEHHVELLAENGRDEFLGGGLAVGAGDAYHRNIEVAAMLTG